MNIRVFFKLSVLVVCFYLFYFFIFFASSNEIVTKIEGYNLYKEHSIDHIKYKETGGRIFFEGVLKLYWGLKKHIVLASGSSNNYGRGQRGRESSYNYISIDDEGFDRMIANVISIFYMYLA